MSLLGTVTVTDLVKKLLTVGPDHKIKMVTTSKGRALTVSETGDIIWFQPGNTFSKYVSFTNMREIPHLKGEITVEDLIIGLFEVRPKDTLSMSTKDTTLALVCGEKTNEMIIRRVSPLWVM